MRYRILAVLLSFAVFWGIGCAGEPEPPPRAAPKPEPAPPPLKLPFSDPRLKHHPASPVEADQLVTDIEKDWPPAEDDPLRHPKDLDDALTILKLDQRSLFSAAIAVAKKDESVEARALVAQIELAWGESYAIMMDLLLLLGNHLDRVTMSLEMKQRRSKTDEADLAQLLKLEERVENVVSLFQVLNSDHVARGAKLSAAVIKDFPESYLGYRLAADHYRILRLWEKYDVMVAKIEEINPDSNGLRFLRGAEALQRRADPVEAAEFYQAAIRKDVDFVRAQTHLILCQPDIEGIYAEFQNLKVVNPNHQLVQWLDEAMELAYELMPE